MNKRNRILSVLLFLPVVLAPLVGITQPSSSTQTPAASKKPLYFCPMHPAITSDHPGQCPICHMDLELATEPQMPHMDTHDVPGHVNFELSEEGQQQSGVRTGTVSRQQISHVIRAFARVAYDAEAFTALRDYQLARRNSEQMSQGPSAGLKRGAEELVRAAELKLKLMGLDEESLKQAAFDPSAFLLPEGAVWISADIYESEIGLVRRGMKVKVAAPAFPMTVFEGQVVSIAPVLNSATRTFTVRIKAKDPERLLQPEMFVNATIEVDLGNVLAVPAEALMRAGNEELAFVASDKTHFEPRQVKVGLRGGDYYQVLDGLKEGEKVVIGANFLIDSESRLRSTLESSQAKGNGTGESAPAHHH